MLEPIDLGFLGLAARDRRLRGRDRRRARALRLRRRRRRSRGCSEGLARARPRARRHPPPAPLAHPLRPRGRGGPDRARASRADRLGLRGRRAAPGRPVAARGLGAAPLRRSVRHALGRARAGARARTSASPTATSSAGRRSRRRATPRTTSATCGTGRCSPATRAGFGSSRREYVFPAAPPPDIDLEAWHALDREIRGREPRAARADPLRRRDRRRRPPGAPRAPSSTAGPRSSATGWTARSSPPPGEAAVGRRSRRSTSGRPVRPVLAGAPPLLGQARRARPLGVA